MSGNIILNIGGSGGGTSLNFKVVGNPEPVNPSENTIWVNTDVKITVYVFSAVEPADPVDGMVWISTSTSSLVEFNALKKNGIQVYPISAKQYVGGAWVGVTAKTRQNGAWVDWWDGYLFKNGDEYESVTGGWVSAPKAYNAGTNAVAAKITKADGTITASPNGDGGCILYTANKIDLSGYSTLIFDGKVSNATAYESLANMRVWSEIGSYSTSNAVATASLQRNVDGEVTLDVSGLDGEYYIGFGLYASGTVVMRSMRLE